MNNKNRSLQLRNWFTGMLLCALASTVFGDDAALVAEDAASAESANGSRAQLRLQQRFVSEFSGFAGSADNALNLYSGLRKGSRITLVAPADNGKGGAGTSVLQFNPVARPMGIGSSFISVTLARQQLANHGIARPAPGQIQAALNGGVIIPGTARSDPVALKGVLAQREQGAGWSVLAKASGISLGKVLEGLRHPPEDRVAVADNNPYSGLPAVNRGNGNAVATAGPTPGAMRTAADVTVRSTGLTAQ